MDENRTDFDDSRDVRTGEGAHPRGDRVGPPLTSEVTDGEAGPASGEDPVNAVNRYARPSDFTMEEIDEGDTPLEDEMGQLIDPSLGRERMSTNMDVLDLDSSWIEESEEPDFSDDPGTADVIAVVEEGETYFPPVDPPLRADRNQGARIVGGFSAESLEEPGEPEDHPQRVQMSDDELLEQVQYALAADSYTGDLNIEVEVIDGVAYLHGKVGSLDDIEQAEQVAGSVPGVEDVEEDLEIV
jgi:hypothetical protein